MRSRKRFGQHFLEAAWVTKLIDAVKPSRSDTFLEIGAGRGALTQALAPRVKRLIAVEIDRDLAAELSLDVSANVRVVEADCLDVDLDALLTGEAAPVRVIGNLPYNISSPILFRLLAAHDEGRLIADATLMLQREVADRIVARPGGSDYGVLAIQTALQADVERLLTLPPGAFRPPPKVTSAVVALRFHQARVDVGDRRAFERLVRGMFTQRRKTLLNALRPVTGLDAAGVRQVLEHVGVDPNRRPQTLTLEEVGRLALALQRP